jgi:hypothetical protein
MTQSRQFILKQVATLVRLGVSEIDIERTISFVDAHLPADADATTWIPSVADLQDDGLISERSVLDARQAFYSDKRVPRRMRRLLDARGVA